MAAPRRLGALAACLVGLFASTGCQSTPLEPWMMGQWELETGDVEAAVTHLEVARRSAPDFAPTYLSLAAAHTRLGDYPAVADDLRTYLDLEPGHAAVHLYLGECLRKLERHGEAETEFRRFLEKTQQGPITSHGHQRIAFCQRRLASYALDRGDVGGEQFHLALATRYEATVAAGRERELLRGRAIDLLAEAEISLPTDDPRRHDLVDERRRLLELASAGQEAASPTAPARSPAAPEALALPPFPTTGTAN